ncbi:alpha/beta fold hydrolase [Nesterenkonia muleiensis]|uniref:alpha/beta fold hydrolase n=1 Tax=Nesterenkonia muleiensis TaxID=2282648 RepID=UPI000E7075DC|nr:alpha/beta hydrolase [Nesterenkonia muleiensis]
MEELIRPTRGQGRVIDIDDISVYLEEHGEGPPVLLLHGGLIDHQSWGNQIPALAEMFRVISPDTRAHGRSSDSEKPLSYQRFADDAAELLAALGAAKAHIVGFSDGGCTGLLLALRHPELVDRLVLLGTPYHTSNYCEGVIEAYKTLTPEVYRSTADLHSHVGEAVSKAKRRFADARAWERFFIKLVTQVWLTQPTLVLEDLKRIEAPTLVLHGEKEEYISREASEEMARTIPEASLRFIPGASHMSAQESPEAVNAAILSFLQPA